MNINASIIDQRLAGVREEIRGLARDELRINDEARLKSLAFVYLCVKTMLDLDADGSFDCLTDGGGDFGVDAMHVTEEMDGEFAGVFDDFEGALVGILPEAGYQAGHRDGSRVG